MSALDQRIDALYQLPLADFTAARNALAKTLTGDQSKHVRTLKKPTVVPWAINQLFGRARPLYNRVLEKGRALRTAQLAALKGKKTDVRAATDAHRQAVAEAVHHATQLAATAGVKPDAELLAQTFEALSIAADHPPAPGRLTDILRPPGFETLAGVIIANAGTPAADTHTRGSGAPAGRSASSRAAWDTERRRAAQQRAEALVRNATHDLERAVRAASTTQRDLDRATATVRLAEKTLAAAREALERITNDKG